MENFVVRNFLNVVRFMVFLIVFFFNVIGSILFIIWDIKGI